MCSHSANTSAMWSGSSRTNSSAASGYRTNRPFKTSDPASPASTAQANQFFPDARVTEFEHLIEMRISHAVRS